MQIVFDQGKFNAHANLTLAHKLEKKLYIAQVPCITHYYLTSPFLLVCKVFKSKYTNFDAVQSTLELVFKAWVNCTRQQLYRDGNQSESYFYLLRTAINDKVEKSRENYSNPLQLDNLPAV